MQKTENIRTLIVVDCYELRLSSAVRNDPLENLINVKIDQETKNKINLML